MVEQRNKHIQSELKEQSLKVTVRDLARFKHIMERRSRAVAPANAAPLAAQDTSIGTLIRSL